MSDQEISLPDNYLGRLVALLASSRGWETTSMNDSPAALRKGQTDDWEIFTLEPSIDDLGRLSKITLESPARMCTIFTNSADYYQTLAQTNGLDILVANETAMAVALSAQVYKPPKTESNGQFHTECETVNSVIRLVMTCEGQPAAAGTVVVDGELALFDRISTEQSFRRRGLASRVIKELSARASEQGATTGLLIATVSGNHLYKQLGWQTICQVVVTGNRAGNPLLGDKKPASK